MNVFTFVQKLITEARKFTVAAVGAVAVFVPFVAHFDPSATRVWAEIVAVLTALGVYHIPNASAPKAARRR